MIKGFLTVCYAVLTSTVACASMTSEDLSFVASLDGTTQKYLKLTPANLPAEKIDVMIWLHGHGCDRLKVLESRGECSGSRDFCEQSGMLLVSPDYRAQTSWMGPAAEADTLQLIGILKDAYDVGRIFFVGGSMGGTSSLTFAARHPDLVAGVTAFNPLADHMTYEKFQDAIAASFGGTKEQIPGEYRARSAINYIDELTMPLAITVGGQDTTIPPDSARELARLVEAAHPGNVYLDDVASRAHETDYGATLKALRQMLCRANGTDYDDEYGGGTSGGLVAWWPFGDYGLKDASGNGHTLVAGPEVTIGESAVMAGTKAGNANSGLSVSDIPFSQMDAVTLEIWIRYSAAPEWSWELVELTGNFTSNAGAFNCGYDSSWDRVTSGVRAGSSYSIVDSGSDVLAEKVGEWRHVVAVYTKGKYSGNLRIYVDGVDVTSTTSYNNDTTSVVFPDKTLFFGGRNGAAKVLGEMDSMKVWSRALTAEEVASSYAKGHDSRVLLLVTGCPCDVPCSEMSPAYGQMALTNGETVAFSAKCDLEGVGITGWRIYTNATDSTERVLMLSGNGTRGSLTDPGVSCNLEWQFGLPTSPIVCFASPVEIADGEVCFSCFASNGSAGDVRVLAVYGSSPTSMDSTNEVGLVSSARYFNNVKIRDLPSVGVLCVRLLAVGPTGDVVAASPIKVGRWSAIKKLCHYPFGDMEFRDASGNGLDLTSTDNVTLENGAATFSGSGARPVTSSALDLSGVSSFVASCWVRNTESEPTGCCFMEQAGAWYKTAGAFNVGYDPSFKYLKSFFTGNLKVSGNPSMAIVASAEGAFDGDWHNVAVVYSKKTYPDDIQVYVDGVNRSREITAAEDSTYRGSATATTFAKANMALGGRGSAGANLVGQMDEVLVAECPAGAADAVVAQIHGEGHLAVKGEPLPGSVMVEVPDGCPADQVFPPVGTSYGYAAGEAVPVVAEGRCFDRWLCTLSTNLSNSAAWKTWRRLPAASGVFQHPGIPVKVSWRKKMGLFVSIQ